MANEYKDTLLIGQTNFDMRAGLKEKEPNFQSFWKLNDIYNQKLKLNENKTHFVLHDGPPYANGDLHIGHALNKILKDMIVRWKNSNGFYAPFILGWDTHGLPIETAVTKTGVDRKAIDPVEFRNLCRKFALEQIEKQASQFNRLGIFTNYDVKYVTLNHNYEISELKLFAKMYEKGLIYKALKPIYWSPSSESALAESEIEYQDIKSPSVFVACEITKGNDEVKTGANLIIWTTTPWTLPSNQLIAVGANIKYVLVKPENDNREFIVAKSLLEEISAKLEWVNCSILKTLTASDLVDLAYSHPLYDEKISKVVLGHHVTDESGTGLVHIAGGFGEDDYQIVKQNNLEPFAPIDNQGKFTNEISVLDKELVGKFYEDTNKEIGQRLQAKNKLLKLNFVKHSYPHDWRTKKPVIYRCTLQWFVNLEIVKDDILANVETVETNPTWAKKRLFQVLNDRNDWTISRQRLWGVPIIGFYNKDNELVLTNEILTYAIDKINELGTNAWFSNPADDFLPDEHKNKGYTKEKDILDVWFDSGVSAIALSERFKDLELPYDMYLEGNDQYRGWFNSSMITSTVYSGKSPYKKLVSHGMTTDEKGNKMSKSLGNGIDPIQISNDLGADILRLWVSSTDYTDDQKVGPEILKQISESYRKIRNTMRFILANLSDFDSNSNYQNTLNEVDEFALHNLTLTKNKIIEAYENLQFNQVYNLVINYVTKDLSSFYLDFIKDILYIEKADSVRRRQVQTVLFEQLWFLIDVLRPILVHTIEEVYQELNQANKEKSVHLLDSRKQEFTKDELFVNKWKEIMKLRDDVNKALEEAREEKLISKGFEAILSIQIDKDEFNISAINDLAQIFIVNKIKFINNIGNAKQYEIVKISIVKKDGLKCERCWMIVDNLINDSICERCSKVLAN